MKAYTDLEQSKKLAEILPIEGADMCWTNHCYGSIRSSMIVSSKTIEEYKELLTRFGDLTNIDVFYPCWSLASLLNYLREIDFFPKIEANEFSVTMNVCYYDKNEGKVLTPVHEIKVEAESFVDACYELILKLNEMKMV